MAARFVRDFRVRLNVVDGKGKAPGPLTAAPGRGAGPLSAAPSRDPGPLSAAPGRDPASLAAAPGRDAGAARVLRDPPTRPAAQAGAPIPLSTDNLHDDSLVVRGDDRITINESRREPLIDGNRREPLVEGNRREPLVEGNRRGPLVEEDRREPLLESDIVKAPLARPRRRRQSDQLSNKAIIAITAAVIAIGFGATALLPYILTRPAVDPAQTGTLPAFIPPPEIEQFAPIEPAPVPAPVQPPAVAPSAPALRDTMPVEKSAPALDRTGSVPPAQQATGRAGRSEVPASGAGKGTAPSSHHSDARGAGSHRPRAQSTGNQRAASPRWKRSCADRSGESCGGTWASRAGKASLALRNATASQPLCLYAGAELLP